MSRSMSDAEIRRRKKLQGHISEATGALGLAALGGTLLATKRGGRATAGAFKAVNRPAPKALSSAKLKGHTAPILATSAGIGGAGSFNFAAYTGAESKKKRLPTVAKPEKVAKSMGIEMGYYGEEGNPVILPVIEPVEEIAKAWEPSAGTFDSENSRRKRSKVYEGGSLVAAGGAGAYGARHGAKAAGSLKAKKVLTTSRAVAGSWDEGFHDTKPVKSSLKITRGTASALHHGKRAAAGAAVAGAAVGASQAIRHQRKNSWQSYAKRDTTNAFGIDHSPNGQHRETEN